jgi:hypothetical protein
MAMHSSLLSERQRQLVSKNMIYTEEPSGLLATSKIMQYKSPDYGTLFSGEDGNNLVRFTINGPGLLDPRSIYLQYALRNQTRDLNGNGVPLINCDPGSYSPFKRVRLLSGFNQQVLYDCDGYNVMCAFLDDYLKSVHDLIVEDQGFYALNDNPIQITSTKYVPVYTTTSTANAGTDGTTAASILILAQADGISGSSAYLVAPIGVAANTVPALSKGVFVAAVSYNNQLAGAAAVLTLCNAAGENGNLSAFTDLASKRFAFIPVSGAAQGVLSAAISSSTTMVVNMGASASASGLQVGMAIYGGGITAPNYNTAPAYIASITSDAIVSGNRIITVVCSASIGTASAGDMYTFAPYINQKGVVGGGEACSYNMLSVDSQGQRGLLGAVGNEYLSWVFKPQLAGSSYAAVGIGQGLLGQGGVETSLKADNVWPSQAKLFTISDLPYIGLFTQGKYLPLWALGGIICELYIDNANSWCCPADVDFGAASSTTAVAPSGGSSPSVQLSDMKLYYDNIVPPADFLESMRNQVNSEDGLSLVFPSVNRHLTSLPAIPFAAGQSVSYSSYQRDELLIADHSRMAQTIFQIYRPQALVQHNARPYKLHNRTSAALAQWQLKLNSSYIPQQPLMAVGGNQAAAGVTGCDGTTIQQSQVGAQNYALLNVRQYGQFHKELLKALGQQKRPVGTVMPSQYELLTDSQILGTCDVQAPIVCAGNFMKYGCRGAFAVGIDLTISDDVMTGTNLRNATVTGEMFANVDRFLHPSATATEVSTYVMKLSQVRMTSAGPIIVD